MVQLKLNKIKDIYTGYETPIFKAPIAGRWVEADSHLVVKSPIDLSTIAEAAKPGRGHVEEALSAAYEKGRWEVRDIPGEKRLAIFNKIADLLELYREDFVEVLVLGNGKTRSAANGEVSASIERLRRADLDVRALYGEYVPGDWSTESLEAEAIVKREPLGVVFAITPFNYPLFDAVNKFVYSAVAGNAVVLKPASSTPLPALLFAKVAEEAGFPMRAFSVLPISGREAEELAKDKRIAVVSLTGSTETGEKVIRAAGIKSYVMELGGGDPAIVLEDADVDYTAERIALGITSYSGQRCDSIKLVLAERPVYRELRDKLAAKLNSVKVGDPREPDVQMGPLIDVAAADEFERAVKDAVERGGKILAGGRREKNYIWPTLIEAPAEKVRDYYLYKQEVFASVALIVEVKDVDEAISLANGRRYGLDAAIFGKDIVKIRKAIRYLEVGNIYINDYPKHGIGYFPFGGRKDSGIGREGIGYSIEYVTAYKTIVYNYRGRGIWEYL